MIIHIRKKYAFHCVIDMYFFFQKGIDKKLRTCTNATLIYA